MHAVVTLKKLLVKLKRHQKIALVQEILCHGTIINRRGRHIAERMSPKKLVKGNAYNPTCEQVQ